MKLYYAPGACSLSPHIALLEAGLPYDLVKVDLRAKKLESGDDYLKVNPKGQVPALALDSGELVTEGPVIVQMIADLAYPVFLLHFAIGIFALIAFVRGDSAEQELFARAAALVRAHQIDADADLGRLLETAPPEKTRALSRVPPSKRSRSSFGVA